MRKATMLSAIAALAGSAFGDSIFSPSKGTGEIIPRTTGNVLYDTVNYVYMNSVPLKGFRIPPKSVFGEKRKKGARNAKQLREQRLAMAA